MDFTNYTLFIPVIGIIGILAAFTIYQAVKKQPDGSKEMQDIAASIHEGAMAFLFREYKVLAVLIEYAYLDNPKDYKEWIADWKSWGEAVVKATVEYLGVKYQK